jgi:hypothetical protein
MVMNVTLGGGGGGGAPAPGEQEASAAAIDSAATVPPIDEKLIDFLTMAPAILHPLVIEQASLVSARSFM